MILVFYGVFAVVIACLIYIGWNVYRGVMGLLDDPDTWKLLDHKETDGHQEDC